MCNDSTTFIQQEIQQYKKNCVAQRQLEMQLCQDSSLERTALTQRLLELKVRTQRVRSWMLDTVDNSQINVLTQRTMHRICTAATNEEVSFAYRVAIPRQRFRWRNAFSTRWRSL